MEYLIAGKKHSKQLVQIRLEMLKKVNSLDENYQFSEDFVKEVKFDRLGVFEYSREKETPAYSMKPQILQKVKKQRKKTENKIHHSTSKKHYDDTEGI